MATIPRAALDYLTSQINSISADAQSRVLRVLESVSWTPENVAECRELVVQALEQVMPTYTGLAAQASADFYDAARELSVGSPMGAAAYSGFDPRKTEGAVRGFVRFVLDGRVETFNDQVLQRIDYEMKRSAGYSMVENGARDPLRPRYARVPTGAETCEFCIMLASRGFVYHSRRSVGAIDHYHAGCDCRIVCGFDGMDVEGYDVDALYDRYLDAIESGALDKAALRRSASRGGHGSRKRFGELRSNGGKTFSSMDDVRRYIETAGSLDELYSRGDSAVQAVANYYLREKDREKAMGSIRSVANRRHRDLASSKA